jgi:hypothetical protein
MDMPNTEECSNTNLKKQPRKRITEVLMNYLIEEKFYAQAAELPIGLQSVFEMLATQIDDVIEEKKRFPDQVTLNCHLKPVIEQAREEIRFGQRWSREVLSSLPDLAESRAIKKSFARAAKARLALLRKVLDADERFLIAQSFPCQFPSSGIGGHDDR